MAERERDGAIGVAAYESSRPFPAAQTGEAEGRSGFVGV